ncbi:MAG TPA: hypothetical protein VJS89_10180 [Gammaproteobacteria bacterium]|nr:hypothetical protein [Gammaproteobacteria bacterium]
MTSRRQTETGPLLHGSAKHRRTQSDYMRTLLDRVTLDTWGDVIDGAVTRAKAGDAQARAFLASYLVGRPATDAPTPLRVMTQVIAGDDPLVAALAKPAIDRSKFPSFPGEDEAEATIKVRVAAELSAHVKVDA